MSFKKPNPELVEFFHEIMQPFFAQERVMFGCPVYFINDNMFAGVFQDMIFIRVSQAIKDKIMQDFDEITEFEPLKGRKMREYVTLPETIYTDPEILDELLTKSLHFTESLPKKEGENH